MNSRLSAGHDLESLSNQIEVQILYNEQGAPYCHFIPELGFLAGSSNPNRYLMAEGGYPEMYPGDCDD